jgi:hypothetical protein
MRPGAHSSGRAPRGVGTAGAGHGGRHGFAALPDLYRRCVIRAVALVDPVAGEGFALGALYGPLAVVVWRDARGCRDARLLALKHHVFHNDADAVRIPVAPAKRFIDTMLAGTFTPAG